MISDIDIPGYICHPIHREKRDPRSKRDSGGILFYVKTDLMEGVKIIKKGETELIWFMLDKQFFGLPNDIMVCFCYVR